MEAMATTERAADMEVVLQIRALEALPITNCSPRGRVALQWLAAWAMLAQKVHSLTVCKFCIVIRLVMGLSLFLGALERPTGQQ